MVEGFAKSSEFATGLNTPDETVDAYFDLLNNIEERPALRQEMLNLINGGASDEEVRQFFFSSDAFADNFVDEMYERFLHRDPEIGGREFWSAHIQQNHLDIHELYREILVSVEYEVINTPVDDANVS